jgi:hypothetical protein
MEGLGMENFDVFHGYLVYLCIVGMSFGYTYLMAIWYFCGHLVLWWPFWFVEPRKIWQPCLGQMFPLQLTSDQGFFP